MKYVKSQVCQIGNLSCFGCCGREYGSEEEIRIAIKKNTSDYDDFMKKGKSINKFIKRMTHIRACGLCYNIILKDGKVFCPAHPELNNGVDLRDGYCDILYLCKVAYMYNEWNIKKQKSFKKFINDKNLNWYSFSIGMDNDMLLKEFEEIYND